MISCRLLLRAYLYYLSPSHASWRDARGIAMAVGTTGRNLPEGIVMSCQAPQTLLDVLLLFPRVGFSEQMLQGKHDHHRFHEKSFEQVFRMYVCLTE